CALGEHAVLIKGHEFPKHLGSQSLRQDNIGWTVSYEYAMRYQPVRCALCLDLFWRFPESQGFSLGKDIRQQHVMMPAQRGQRPGKSDEITRDESRALVNQLVERVLAVGSGLAAEDRPGV